MISGSKNQSPPPISSCFLYILCDVCLPRPLSLSAWEFQSDIITMMKTDPINTEHYDEYNSDYGGSNN